MYQFHVITSYIIWTKGVVNKVPPLAEQSHDATSLLFMHFARRSFTSHPGNSRSPHHSPPSAIAARSGKTSQCEVTPSLFFVEGKEALLLTTDSDHQSTASRSSSPPSRQAPPASLGHQIFTGMAPKRDIA
jgi:hypothetical protein